jgi:hypothetical protein
MKNQINLKPEVFSQQFSKKERHIYWAVILFGFIGAIGWAGIDYYQYWKMDQTVQQAKISKNKVLVSLEGMSQSNDKVIDVLALTRETQRNIDLIDKKNTLLNALRQNNPQSNQGFYPILALLSERKNPQMQLSHIFIRQQANSRQLILRGKTYEADVLPNYILSLENSLLNNIKFNFMQMDYHRAGAETENNGLDGYYFSIATGDMNGDAL